MSNTKLKRYQRKGVDMIHAFDDRALLGDEMGLGKTLTAITAAVEIQAFPTLVVCPAPLKRMWAEQIKEHLGMGSRILSSRTPTSTKTLSQEKFLIINYDILGSWLDTLQRAKTKLIIADEVHYAGNLNSQRCRNFMALCENKKKIIAQSPERRWSTDHSSCFRSCTYFFQTDFRVRLCLATHTAMPGESSDHGSLMGRGICLPYIRSSRNCASSGGPVMMSGTNCRR